MKWIFLILFEGFFISMMVWAVILCKRSRKLEAQLAEESGDEVKEDETGEKTEDMVNENSSREGGMLFDNTRLYSKKHNKRDAGMVDFAAESLKNEILKCADGKILPEKAELLAYKCVARLDIDNQAEMSVPMDVRAGLIVKSYLENNYNEKEAESEEWLKKRERTIGKQLMIVRMAHQEADKQEKGLFPLLKREDVASWVDDMSAEELDELLEVCSFLHPFNLCANAAKEFVKNESADEYGYFLATFRKYGDMFVDSMLENKRIDANSLAKENAERIEKMALGINFSEDIKSAERFSEALNSYYNYYIGKISFAVNKGYSWDVVRAMLREDDIKRFGKVRKLIEELRIAQG